MEPNEIAAFEARTSLLLRPEAVSRLHHAHVLVAGLGGVGGYAAEQLCRCGVGKLTIIDNDVVSESNINRQIIALRSTVGRAKAELFKQRFADINPDCQVTAIDEFIRDDRMVEILQSQTFDCVVDAIDTLAPKVFLLYHCHHIGIPVVSSMGSAGKTDPSKIAAADISKSHTCPLAAMVRKRLHRMDVTEGIRVVFSSEKVPQHAMVEELSQNKRTTLGTISYIPPIFGCYCAAEAVNIILNKKPQQ